MDAKTNEGLQALRQLKEKALIGSGLDYIEKQHKKGKLTARERIQRLVDPNSFKEASMLIRHLEGTPNDGIVAGIATIDARPVCIYAQDITSASGTIGTLHGFKLYRTVERALELGVPFIGLQDSPGARVEKLEEYERSIRFEKGGGSVFFPNTEASGVIPQISAILGSCAGISVYSPALTDFVFMVDGISHMFITGPKVVKSVMYEDISMEELGGARVHAQITGICDFRLKSEVECLQAIRKLLSFLPSNCREKPPVKEITDSPDRIDDTLADVVPSDPNKPYDMHKVINSLVDNEDFLEIKREFAPEMIIGFGRLAGMAIGIIANQPLVMGGSLTANGSRKQARFIRFCDAFNIPILLLIDTPAYQPGSVQEHGGIICHGAKVLYALCEATVPRIAVILRKAYGGGNLGMGSNPGLKTDFVLYWPTTETGVMGAEQAINLIYSEQIAKAENPTNLRENLLKQYRDKYANPLFAISYNPYIEDIVEPRETRRELIKLFRYLQTKKVDRYPKRHGNIPL